MVTFNICGRDTSLEWKALRIPALNTRAIKSGHAVKMALRYRFRLAVEEKTGEPLVA